MSNGITTIPIKMNVSCFKGKLPLVLINKGDILKKAEDGDLEAQWWIVKDYSIGNKDYGIEIDPQKLLELAELDWPQARRNVTVGYLYGRFGFEKNEDKANKLKEKWYLQQEKFTECGQS